MAPRVGFEPTTNRLTAGCSTTELPRNSRETHGSALSIKFGAAGKGPPMRGAPKKTRAPFGALEGVGYGGVSPREDAVNMILTGKHTVNGERRFTKPANVLSVRDKRCRAGRAARMGPDRGPRLLAPSICCAMKATRLTKASAAAFREVEASPGIEPGCTDLQSAASPLRHEAAVGRIPKGFRRDEQGRPWSRPARARRLPVVHQGEEHEDRRGDDHQREPADDEFDEEIERRDPEQIRREADDDSNSGN